jgi:hypothetical protein
MNYSRRELPAAPGAYSNGAHNGRPSPSAASSSGRPHMSDMPADGRPPYNTRHTQSGSTDSPVPSAGSSQRLNQYNIPKSETNNDYLTPSHAGGDSIYAAANATVTRNRSKRPPGAGAPYNGAYDVAQNGSPAGKSDPYQHWPNEKYRAADPSQRPYSPSHMPPSPVYTSGQILQSPSDAQFQTPVTVLSAPDGSYCTSLVFGAGQMLTYKRQSVQRSNLPMHQKDPLPLLAITPRSIAKIRPQQVQAPPLYPISVALPPSQRASTVATPPARIRTSHLPIQSAIFLTPTLHTRKQQAPQCRAQQHRRTVSANLSV